MCGICGFYSKNRITADQLTLMNDTMYHRGPDDAGAEIFPIDWSCSCFDISVSYSFWENSASISSMEGRLLRKSFGRA